jgi:WD40 repeat protein
MFRPQSPIVGFDVDDAGRFCATVDDEGRLGVWDLQKGATFEAIRAPDGETFRYVGWRAAGAILTARAVTSSGARYLFWSRNHDQFELLRQIEVPSGRGMDSTAHLVAKSGPDSKTLVWNLRAPADVAPVTLEEGETLMFNPRASPDGRWMATASDKGLHLWPLQGRHPMVFEGHTGMVMGLAFGPQGRWLVSSSWDGSVRRWPLEGASPSEILIEGADELRNLVVTPGGDYALIASENSAVRSVDLDTGEVRLMPFLEDGAYDVAVSPDGRLAAAIGGAWGSQKGVVHVWEVESGRSVSVFEPGERPSFLGIAFATERQILAANETRVVRRDLESGEAEVLLDEEDLGFMCAPESASRPAEWAAA